VNVGYVLKVDLAVVILQSTLIALAFELVPEGSGLPSQVIDVGIDVAKSYPVCVVVVEGQIFVWIAYQLHEVLVFCAAFAEEACLPSPRAYRGLAAPP